MTGSDTRARLLTMSSFPGGSIRLRYTKSTTASIKGTPTVQIAPPDDELLMAVMMKLFSDRQLSPAPQVLPYLTRRIDRSFDAARDIVERLDAAALEHRRPINTTLARDLLDNDDT